MKKESNVFYICEDFSLILVNNGNLHNKNFIQLPAISFTFSMNDNPVIGDFKDGTSLNSHCYLVNTNTAYRTKHANQEQGLMIIFDYEKNYAQFLAAYMNDLPFIDLKFHYSIIKKDYDLLCERKITPEAFVEKVMLNCFNYIEEEFELKLDPRILTCTRYIKANYYKIITNKAMADLCHLSTDRFNHLFKEQMKTSLQTYIMAVRLKNICKKYANGRFFFTSLNESGWFDSSHFSKTFKKFLGSTPSKIFKKK